MFSDSDGVKCTAIKVTFQSHPMSSTNTFYSHVLEVKFPCIILPLIRMLILIVNV